MVPRVLVAGVGNIFLSDDGFGVEVARRLSTSQLPDYVKVTDFGIRAVHLAYELMGIPYELIILVDASPRQGPPGTVYVIEPDLEAVGGSALQDAHGLNPDTVFALLKGLGGTPGRILVVGCEPACLDENMGLSGPVEAAVEEAVKVIVELIHREVTTCV